MKKIFFPMLLLLTTQSWSTEICVTTLFAPAGEIDGVNDEMLAEFDINLSHFVIDEQKIRFYGPQDPASVSSRNGKRVLVGEHDITKVNETTYNLASGKPLIRSANGGAFWKFVFDIEFYKQYEARAYDSILSFCLNANRSDCKQFADQVFQTYVAPVSNQGCAKL